MKTPKEIEADMEKMIPGWPGDKPFAEARCYASMRDVYVNEPLVQKILSNEGRHEDCIVALANLAQQLRKKVIELECVAPRKIVTKEGKVYVWHCPDHLIPASRTIEA